jgi:hypothetical protein
MPIILATQEAEIKRTVVPNKPKQKVLKTPSQQKGLGVELCACHRSYEQET